MTGVRIVFRTRADHYGLVGRYLTCYPLPRIEPQRFPIYNHARMDL